MSGSLHIGDLVRPKPAWRTDLADKPVPSGRVAKIVPWGQGQVVYLDGDDRRPFLAGVFEKVDA